VRYALGIVSVAFGNVGVEDAARRGAELGFEHLDTGVGAIDRLDAATVAELPIPIGDRISGFEVRGGCTGMAPLERRGEDRFDETVELFRRNPGARLEPGPRTAANSIAKAEALVAAVPGLRLTVDTGHIATWGEDPVRLLHLADHVQLRQAAEGQPQLYPDVGDVDFSAVLAELVRLDYRGLVSIEYFDLPDYGWPLEDPVGHAVALAAHVRALGS
jgi:sugar phosphate isomerase/epimerase